jgi:rod shape determining protein RodA
MSPAMATFDVHDATIRAFNPRNLRHVDWMMPIFMLLLAAVGWAVLYSASRGIDSEDPYYHFHRQVIYFAVGLLIAGLIICLDYRLLIALAPIAYVLTVGLLLAVHFFGVEVSGAQRWLDLGFTRIQPAEFSKLVMVYSLAWYLSLMRHRIRKFHWFALTFVITGLPMLLILKQPSLGTAASLAPIMFVMLFVAGARYRHLLLIVGAGLLMIPYISLQLKGFDPSVETKPKHSFELTHYQKKRIYTFMHPETDIRGSGWHTIQSAITVGSGGLTGKGYLNSTQTQLHYLPEHHTDFIFSLLAEEHGFIGAMVLIGLFSAFLLRGLMFARDCPDMAGTLLATGAVTLLAFHVFVNIAITIGVLPVTGIPLPFLSFGGSFYMTTMAFVGVMLNVPMRRRVLVN